MDQCSILILLDMPSSLLKFESSHQTFFVGRPGWLTSALIRNTCALFIISDKLEALSEIVNPTFLKIHNEIPFLHNTDLLNGI